MSADARSRTDREVGQTGAAAREGTGPPISRGRTCAPAEPGEGPAPPQARDAPLAPFHRAPHPHAGRHPVFSREPVRGEKHADHESRTTFV